jgi:O-antigen ligase
VQTYLRTDFVVLFLIAGLVMTWRECWRLLGMISIACTVTLLLGFLFKDETMGADDRLSIASGLTMGNANDYAAILILLLPFLALVLITPRRAVVLRILAVCGLVSGIYLVLSTGSRGAEIGMLVAVAMAIYRLPALKKLWITLAALMVVAVMWQILPRNITQRLVTTLSTDDPTVREAAGSAEARQYVLQQSLLFTIQHPLFGVGPGQFADHEGFGARAAGQQGNWHGTHNSYTQVSSEVGIPAALFFLAALFSTYRLLSGALKKLRARPPSRQNATMMAGVLCVLIGTVAFYTSAFFLTLAYFFYFPALTAIAIVLSRAVEREPINQSSPYAVR